MFFFLLRLLVLRTERPQGELLIPPQFLQLITIDKYISQCYYVSMIKVIPLEVGLVQVKSTMRLTHPRTNLLTVQVGHDAYCNFPVTVEFAFSNGYAFLTDVLPDFASYAVLIDDSETMKYYNMRSESHDGRVMTYQNVPIVAFAKFVNMYAEKEPTT